MANSPNLQVTQLKDYRSFYPKGLSGGMQQRVAIARTLINCPALVLMDEPFGSLDPQIREQMQNLITNIYEQDKRTIIFITHDMTEGILLADKIYVLSSKPMKIISYFEVSLKRPRDYHLKYTQEFFELEKEISKTFCNSSYTAV